MEELEGTVESIVFFNPDNGYTVCRFSTEKGDRVTAVGTFPALSPGEVMKLKGDWELNVRFGRQFKVDTFIPMIPASAKGIEKFLASGLVRGIGPVLARRIVKKFGEQTLDILSRQPDKMREVEGIGAVKLAEIKKSWLENQHVRDLIIFLQEHQVSTNIATKVYRQYAEKSFQVLKTNPYQLCLDIWGIGFRTADQIALKLGLDPSSQERIKAFIFYLMEKDNEQGHVFSNQADLEKNCIQELAVSEVKAKQALDSLAQKGLVVREALDSGSAVYLPSLYQAQEEIVRSIQRLVSVPPASPPFDPAQAVAEEEKTMGLVFSEKQRTAIIECFQKKILVITGGPGTGKTTIIRAVVELFGRWGQNVLLAAPTGRAAKRLSEATRQEAKTIHRVLEFNPKQATFRRNERHPLKAEALVVDEFSMVDLLLMHHLIKAVPPHMRLILVGDKDQLPSVGPGSLLGDLIDSQRLDVVRLDEIFRQEKGSLIVLNAHRVNQGLNLLYPEREDKDADFYFLHCEDEEKAFKTILNLCRYRVPQKLGLPALSPQIQVISPMYKGMVGVDRLNSELQQSLNPYSDGLKLGTREIRVHDKLMQVRNDYEKEVFNGDIGLVTHIDPRAFRVYVDFDGRVVCYEKDELNDIVLAYAVSVHKSQGSEYQAVVMPLMTQHFIMLQRNLFYTALTRAKKLSVIVGSYRALHIAIKNDKPVKRNGLLKEKLVRSLPASLAVNPF